MTPVQKVYPITLIKCDKYVGVTKCLVIVFCQILSSHCFGHMLKGTQLTSLLYDCFVVVIIDNVLYWKQQTDQQCTLQIRVISVNSHNVLKVLDWLTCGPNVYLSLIKMWHQVVGVVVGAYLQMVHRQLSAESASARLALLRCIAVQYNGAKDAKCTVKHQLWLHCDTLQSPSVQLFSALQVSINVSGSSLLPHYWVSFSIKTKDREPANGTGKQFL